MQIELPNHPKLQSHAVAAGFANVQQFVQHLVEVEVGPLDESDDRGVIPPFSTPEWQRRFDAFLSQVKCVGANADASRESIYGEHVARINPT